MLDASAPHLHPLMKEAITKKGHVHFPLGGGSTPWLATNDTHAHAPYEKDYEDAEVADNMAQLRRSRRVPSTSRQRVLERAHGSWIRGVNHERIATQAFKENALSNTLDGSEDHLISRRNLVFWHELDMATIRDQLIQKWTVLLTIKR